MYNLKSNQIKPVDGAAKLGEVNKVSGGSWI